MEETSNVDLKKKNNTHRPEAMPGEHDSGEHINAEVKQPSKSDARVHTDPVAEQAPTPQPVPAESIFIERVNGLRPNLRGQKEPSAPDEILAQIYRIERTGSKLTPKRLGRAAGAAVMDQYRAAKSEISVRWWQAGSLMLTGGLNMVAVAAPLAAIVAGGAIDWAIFGGAALELTQVNPYFKTLAAGSLVFATGIGLSERASTKRFFGALMIAAALGASMMGADDARFKEHFAKMLPNSLRAPTNKAVESVAEAKVREKLTGEKLASDTHMLFHGGKDGKHMDEDGDRKNDARALELKKVIIPADEAAHQEAMQAVARAESQKDVANKDDPASWWGQILGALYLGSWLVASQLAVAKGIEKARKLCDGEREVFTIRRSKELFVKDLESSRGEAAARTEVSNILLRIHDALTDACVKHPVSGQTQSRLAQIDALFSDENYDTALEEGVKAVAGHVHPRQERYEDYEQHAVGRIGAFFGRRRRETTLSPKP